ncbi:M81 family metallopeptidase [Falsiroseomonas sp. E2-1-a20]|uniref:M81 family metallopeptidase n=1 Tax=Falsiroseomonas sp. E2-1-a20 TaxID=3239300 RepID=UPI003F35A07B
MRIAIAGLSLESVSFLPIETTIEDFKRTESSGAGMLTRYRGTNTVPGGFIAVCEREGAELVPILRAEGGAAGPASDEAFVHYSDRICAGLKAVEPLDGVLLNLHGAMATPTRLDPDRELTERVRAVIGRKVPLVVALDYHANIDASLLEMADAVFGYRFSPHVDMGETGERAADCMIRMLRGELRPSCALFKPGVMVPSIFSATSLPPLSDIVAESIRMSKEAPHYLDISVFAGFSYADVPNCGFSVLAVSGAGQASANDAARKLCDRIYAERHALVHRELVKGLEDGIAHALDHARNAKKPIVLLEHADRMNDSTHVLRALMGRTNGIRVAVPFVWDPAAAAAAVQAGQGATVSLDIGGHSSDGAGGPVRIKGRVIFAGEKPYRTTGPMRHGNPVELGPTAVIESGDLMISVTTAQTTAIDEDCFIQFGMKATDFGIIVLRSKTHFRAVYEPLAEEILIVDTPDWGPAELSTLPYRHVPTDRIFPFTDPT